MQSVGCFFRRERSPVTLALIRRQIDCIVDSAEIALERRSVLANLLIVRRRSFETIRSGLLMIY